MYETQHHEMRLETTYPSGAEEWYCPTCGRRIMRRVPPTRAMIVVEPGDQSVIHSGSKGGLRISAVQVTQQEPERDDIPEEKLRPWTKALGDLDLGD